MASEQDIDRLLASHGEHPNVVITHEIARRAREAVRERDEAIARAEAAEAKLAAVHRAITDMHAEAQVKADAHSALTDYWAGFEEGLDRAADAVRVVLDGPDGPPAWQRKPITHEWSIRHASNAVEAAQRLWVLAIGGEWRPGRPSRSRGLAWFIPLSRPIKPTKGSERGDA